MPAEGPYNGVTAIRVQYASRKPSLQCAVRVFYCVAPGFTPGGLVVRVLFNSPGFQKSPDLLPFTGPVKSGTSRVLKLDLSSRVTHSITPSAAAYLKKKAARFGLPFLMHLPCRKRLLIARKPVLQCQDFLPLVGDNGLG